MDLQTRKLNLIEYILKLKDNKVLSLVEDAITKTAGSPDQELKQFTEEELLGRAEESNADYRAGNIKTQDKLENESENW